MKRKLFTFLVAFLATLSGAVWGQTAIDLGIPSVSGNGASINSGTKTIKIDQAGDYVITGSTTEYQVSIGSTSGTGTVNVTLSDATIELSGSNIYPIQIVENNQLFVNLVIEGENVVSTTGGQAGITVPYESSMEISGTGILNTYGQCGIGNANNSIAGGVCGNITIKSGTVVANGSSWCIGGYNDVTKESQLPSPKLAMTGDALLVVYDESTNRDKGIYNMNYWGLGSHPDHGIYCNAKAQADFGSLYSDVTLQSPFPSDDFVVDLNRHTLTLGAGSYARINQITGLDEGGTLNAYKVTYEDNLDKTWGVNPINPLPETLYYGAGYKVASWDAGIEPKVTSDDQKNNAIYKQVPGKWWNGTDWVAANSVPYTSDASGIVEVNYGAAWYLAEFNPTYSDTEGFQGSRTFWIPAKANFEWKDAENPTSLAGAGLQIDANQIKGLSTTPISGGEYEINLTCNVPANAPALTCKINATVTSSALNVGDGTKVNVELLKERGEYKGSISTTSGYSSVEIIKVSCMYSEGTWTEVRMGYTVQYQKDGEADWNTLSGKLQEVGTYKIKVVGTGNMLTGEKEVGTFTITPKVVTIQAEPVTIKAGESETVEGQFSFVSGVIEGESEYLTIKANPLDVNNYSEAGEYNVTYTGISLESEEPYSQLHENYSVTSTIGGKLFVKKEGTDENPITPGDPEDEETEIKIDGDNWEWDTDGYTRVYDGTTLSLEKDNLIYVKQKKDDNTYWKAVPASAISVISVTPDSPIKNVDTYTVKLSIAETEGILYSGVVEIKLFVTARPMVVTFVVPSHIESTDPITITKAHVTYEPQNENSGLVANEVPEIKSGEFVFEESSIEGKYKVILHDFVLGSSNTFNPNNYKLQIWDAAEGKYVEYKNTGDDITIIDPTNPDNNPNTPADGVVVGTDDDSNDEGDGDGDSDIKLFRIYTDEVCAGVELEYSREVVKGGQSTIVTVNVEKGYDASALKLSYKEGLYGDWKPLILNEDGQYQIKNIWKDIYVRAEGVVTGMEDIDGAARVYAKDGSLYIYTPQQDDITVVSMTGAVVKRTKQIGLQSYPLNQGIYVVRVGEQVFKIRVK